MQYQSYLIDATRHAGSRFFDFARAVPADKLEWAPAEGARTTLDIAREIAMCPQWGIDTVEGMPEWDEAVMAEYERQTKALVTLDDCQTEFNRRMDKLAEYVSGLDDEFLKEERDLIFTPGRKWKVADLIDFPRWNCTYHIGQVAYIQTCYGDKDMH
ncbi:MAG: hypothetical protein JST35_06910 [Armatimonadetes bacterium]|nr:hypothetical protein [Armatimonadota bacterium]